MILAHLSDLHIRPSGVAAYRVVETNMLAERALRSVAAMRPRPDAVVISGDIADCGLASEYAGTLVLLHLGDVPVYLVPGNHDRRERFREGLGAFPGVDSHRDFIQYVVDDLPVRLVMLDSVVPGAGHGELCAARLAWLDNALATAPERPTMLVLHHPPITCGIASMDAINLRDPTGLAQVVARHPQVERILCGHHHRSIIGRLAQAIVSVVPSVAHQSQFDLVLEHDGFVMEPPAYQVHVRLPDGTIASHTIFVESYPGPYPFIADPDYPGRPGNSDPGSDAAAKAEL